VLVVNEGDDPHLRFALEALQGVDLIYALYARGPTTLAELLPIVARSFLTKRKRAQ
jgi:hypothetical protein